MAFCCTSLRFAGPVKLDASRCRRFLDIDHDREEAFAAFDGEGAMLGVARLAASVARFRPGKRVAEIALSDGGAIRLHSFP